MINVQGIFNKYIAGYSKLSLIAVTQLSDIKLAEDLTSAIPVLSKDDAFNIAPQVRALANAKAKEMETQEVKAAPHEVPKVDFWGMVKDLKITDVEVFLYPIVKTPYTVKNLAVAHLQNGKMVKVDEQIYKGPDAHQAEKLGPDYFKKEELGYLGKPLSERTSERTFVFLNTYEEYVKQKPAPVQMRVEVVEREQPAVDIQALFDRYKRSTVLPVSVLASSKFMNDEAVAKDISQNLQMSMEEAHALVPRFRAIVANIIHKEEIESIKENIGIDVEKEAHKLGIDLTDYAIIPAGSRIVLQHKTIVQRRYELKSPAGYIKRRDEEWQERYRKSAGRVSLTVKEPEDYYSGSEVTVAVGEPPNFLNGILKRMLDRGETVEVQIYGETNIIKVPIDKVRVRKIVTKQLLPQVTPPAAPPSAKPVQSMQDVKQQVMSSIQAASTVEELQSILKGIGFLPLPAPEKQQVMDAYQNKYSTLKSERPFGAPVKTEKKTAAPTPQQLFEAEQRRKLEEARTISVTPTLTGGAVTAKRLEMFEPGTMEKAKAEADARRRIEQLGLPYEIHPYIKKLASGTQDVMKFGTKRGKETVEDLVLSRYVRFCPPGTIIDNRSIPKVPERWWVYPPKLRACMGEIEKKVAQAGAVQECMVRENIQPAMTESMRSYIRGAQPVRDVIHYDGMVTIFATELEEV